MSECSGQTDAPPGGRAAANHGQRGRAPRPATALPRVRQAHAGRASSRGCRQLLWPAPPSGGGDAVGAQPRLSRGRGRALRRAVRRRISSGTIDAILSRTAQALCGPHEDLLERLRGAQALNMDETGWRTAGERRALWGLFDQRHAYFTVEPTRHEDRAKTLLADTQAIVTSDRWWAYAHLPLRSGVSSAGRTCGEISRRTPKGSPPRRSSARRGSTCARGCSGRGRSSPTP